MRNRLFLHREIVSKNISRKSFLLSTFALVFSVYERNQNKCEIRFKNKGKIKSAREDEKRKLYNFNFRWIFIKDTADACLFVLLPVYK